MQCSGARLEVLIAVLLGDAPLAEVQAAAERVGVVLVTGGLLLHEARRQAHLARQQQLLRLPARTCRGPQLCRRTRCSAG